MPRLISTPITIFQMYSTKRDNNFFPHRFSFLADGKKVNVNNYPIERMEDEDLALSPENTTKGCMSQQNFVFYFLVSK